jgi:hypothetical protein
MRVELLAILVLAVSATGCGEESPNPEEVVSAAVTGLSKGDEKKVCAQLTEPARRKLLDVLADDPRSSSRSRPRRARRRSRRSTRS